MPGLVGAAGRRVAGDDRDGRDPGRRLPGQVAEVGAAGDEDLLLPRQVGAARLDEADRRQPVRHRDLLGAQVLAQRVGVGGAAAHRRVGAADQALDALDHPDPADLGAPDLVLGAVGAERRRSRGTGSRGRAAARFAPAAAAGRASGGARSASRPRRGAPSPAPRRASRAARASIRGWPRTSRSACLCGFRGLGQSRK